MQTPPWSKTQLNKLGTALASGQEPPPGAPSYSEVMRWYSDRTNDVQERVSRLAWKDMLGDRYFKISSRPKTRTTLVQKLRRNPKMMLARVDDICGVRFDADMTLDEQDAAAAAISVALEEHPLSSGPAKTRDLRPSPHAGYRAVHVIAVLDVPVEVQVRTALQSEWANVYEEFGDLHGREVRYAGEQVTPGLEHAARVLQQISVEVIGELEDKENHLARLGASLAAERLRRQSLNPRQKRHHLAQLRRLEAQHSELMRQASNSRTQTRAMMTQMDNLVRTDGFAQFAKLEVL